MAPRNSDYLHVRCEWITQEEYARMDLERVCDEEAKKVEPSFSSLSEFMFYDRRTGIYYIVG